MQTMRNEIQEPGKVQVSHWFVHEEVLVMLTSTPSQHVKNHTKPQGCQHCDRRFATPSDLNRHVKARHRVKHELFHCSYPNCRFTTIRKDYLPQHLSIIHQLEPGIDQRKSLGEQKEGQDLDLLRRANMFQLAESGNMHYMKTLLDARAVLEIQGDDGSTLLHCSARAGQVEMVEYLLDQKANINQKNSKGGTPLHEAVAGGSQEVIELLLGHGADFTLRDYTGKTATDYAVVAGRVDITQRLLESYGSERVREVARLLLSAIEAGQSSMIEWLLSHQGVLLESVIMLGVLRKACQYGHTGLVSQLLELDYIYVNIILRYRCLLHWASIRGHIETVSLLLQHKDIHIDDNIVLMIMAYWFRFKPPKKRLDILRLLLQHPSFNINPADCSITTLLHKAARRGLADGVRLLFDCKDPNIDINARNDRYETALQLARQGFERMAPLKKRYESDKNMVTWFALQQQPYKKIISILLAQGAMEDICDRNISTSIFDEPTTICSDGNKTTMEFSGLSDLDEEVDMYYDGEANAITE
jgi:ankyrin repeat protein